MKSEITTSPVRFVWTQLHAFMGMEKNWDSYAGVPVKSDAALAAFSWYVRSKPELDSDFDSAPSVVPCSDGSVQLEWHIDGLDLEVYFEENGEMDLHRDDRRKNGATP